jgi:hypothetical protein
VGKRIEDLRKLDLDHPIERQVEALDAKRARDEQDGGDERDQPWYQFVGEIDDLLASGDYDWAFDTLHGIRETVEHSRRVSEGQRRAVANVEAARGLAGRRRRYEGYRGRWR